MAPAVPRAASSGFRSAPSLGQCCGGVVQLAFEVLGAEDLGWIEAVEAAFAAGRGAGAHRAGLRRRHRGAEPRAAAVRGAARRWRLDRHPGAGRHARGAVRRRPRRPCVGQGARHAAVPRALGGRARHAVPGGLPENVEAEASDTPEAVVDQAPPARLFPGHDATATRWTRRSRADLSPHGLRRTSA